MLALVGTTGLALGVRLGLAAPGGGLVDVDGDLHLRRAAEVLAHGPGVLGRLDPLLAWPSGAHVPWPPGFDLLLAGLGRLFGPGRLEWVASIAIAVLGAAAIPVAFALARAVVGRAAALGTALAVALLPGHVELTRFGRVDHHVLEPLLLWAALALLLFAARPEAAPRPRRGDVQAVAGGLVLALLVATVPTALLGIALVGGAALWIGRERARAPILLLLSAAVGAALVALFCGGLHRLSMDEPSAFQPALLGGLALLVLLGARLRPGAARIALLFGGAAALGALALGLGLGVATLRMARTAGLGGTVLESRGLFAFGLYQALAPLSGLAFLTPLAVPLALRRRGFDDGRLVLGATALVLLGVALLQRRFMHLGGAPIAAVLLDAAGTLRWRRAPAALAAAGALACCLPCLRYLTLAPPRNLRVDAVRELAPVLRGLPPGAVLAQWPFGHILARLGGAPVVASPLMTPETEPDAEEGTAILLEGDVGRALARLDRLNVRYVVATALPPGVTARYLTALHDPRPPAAAAATALVTRLVAADGDQVPGLREIASSSDARAKLFERVAGAVVEGGAPPGSPVVATLSLEDAPRRRFLVTQHARADAGGRYRLLLPYATNGLPERLRTHRDGEPGIIRPLGHWRITGAGRPPAEVALDLAAVREARRVEVRE